MVQKESEKKTSYKVNTNSEDLNESKLISLARIIKKIITSLTVEPFLFCYIFAITISFSTENILRFHKACQSDLGNPEYICVNAINGDFDENDNSSSIYLAVIKESRSVIAEIQAWTYPIEVGMSAIILFFVGAWSDKTGNRKALMILPIFGELIATVGIILTIYFFKLPFWVTRFIEIIPTVFTGGLNTVMVGSYSFIAEVTTIESRFFRITLLSIFIVRAISFALTIRNIIMGTLGYYGVYSLKFILNGIGFLYVYFRIKDVKPKSLKGSLLEKLIKFLNPRNAWETASLLFLSRGQELIRTILLLVAHIVFAGSITGLARVLYVYVIESNLISNDKLLLFKLLLIFVEISGASVAATVFSKWLKIDDSVIALVATITYICSSLMYAFASNRTWLYSAVVIGLFSIICHTSVWSLATKIVPAEKVGKMCSLMCCVGQLASEVSIPVYKKVYSNTVAIFSGGVFLFNCIMLIPPLVIFICLYCMHRKEDRDVIKSKLQRDVNGPDIEITAL